MVGGLLRDIEEGYTKRVAVMIPPGPGWPLRGYELALLISQHACDMSADLELTVVEPDPPPLALAGDRAVQLVAAELERAQTRVVSANQVSLEREPHLTLFLHPSRRTLEVDRVLAMPMLRGRAIDGIPADHDGLIEGRRALPGHQALTGCVGGRGLHLLAAEVGRPLGRASGRSRAGHRRPRGGGRRAAPVQSRACRGVFSGCPPGGYLEQRLAADERGLTMHLPTTGVPVLTYLQEDLAAGWRGRG